MGSSPVGSVSGGLRLRWDKTPVGYPPLCSTPIKGDPMLQEEDLKTKCKGVLEEVSSKKKGTRGVGKGILCLTKHPDKKIQTMASELRQYWKDLVVDEVTNSNKKKNTLEDRASPQVGEKSNQAVTIKVERVQSSGAMRVDGVPRSEAFKSERNGLHENISESGSVKIKSSMKVEIIKVEKATREEKQSTVFRPPKLTSMLKCNDELRDKFREIMAEALSKVHGEAPEEMKDEVAACDPIRVAVSVESLMFEKLGRSNGAQKAKYRSIMFNMRDSKNPDLRRRVLLGHVKPPQLITMTPEEMASDDRKRQNQQIKDKAIFECERGAPAKATTDQFKCGRCGKRKTTYYQMQTRSADEPMTTYVTCVECNHHWKFC
ncbi:hypothetical protein Taro_050290 [Colocasia esculenta]|uniref:Transcription elongation factor n=1 Tax=Colocasia esculenta TaxID=4460 RepID=A0A843XDF5_COLES|nr:hypothetical protein [Colocasia esculenta]